MTGLRSKITSIAIIFAMVVFFGSWNSISAQTPTDPGVGVGQQGEHEGENVDVGDAAKDGIEGPEGPEGPEAPESAATSTLSKARTDANSERNEDRDLNEQNGPNNQSGPDAEGPNR